MDLCTLQDPGRAWESGRGSQSRSSERGKHSDDVISCDAWAHIELPISDLRVVGGVRAAQSCVENLDRRMATLVQDDAAREMLRCLATETRP